MKLLTLALVTIIIISIIPYGSSIIKFILDEEITNCGKKSWLLNLDDFHLIMVNDTTTIANGTSIPVETIDSPWKLHFYGEMYDRGQWTKKFERKFDDFCKNVLKPGEIWFDTFHKKLNGTGCPFVKGRKFYANEEAVYFDVSFMPVWFQGRWRFTMEGTLGCYRVHFDFVDF